MGSHFRVAQLFIDIITQFVYFMVSINIYWLFSDVGTYTFAFVNTIITLNPQLHSRSATYIKRNGLLIRKITIKSSRPFQCAYHPLTP